MPRPAVPSVLSQARLAELAAAHLEAAFPPRRPRRPGPLELAIRTQALEGLESGGVLVVDASARTPDGERAEASLVVKPLVGHAAREGRVYRWLAADGHGDLCPLILHDTSREADGGGVLVMERLRPLSAWPWANPDLAGRVLERLARFHASADIERFTKAVPPPPDADRLGSEVRETLRVIDRAMDWGALKAFRRARPRLRRVGDALAAGRHRSAPGLPAAVLHGDLHSGNVVVERGGRFALLDWNRARVGSPLEDVAAWLQSLAFWEPEVRRTHDTLLRRYLGARGLGLPGPALRDAYWLAAARNGYTGALRYHVTVLEDASVRPRARENAGRALRDWFRIIRRADRGLARPASTAASRTP